MTVQQRIKDQAAVYGAKTFLLLPDQNEELSFEQLHTRVASISAQFTKMDLRVGGHVALLMENSQWTVSLLLAIMASGRIAVPLDVTATDEQLQPVLQHCDATILFASKTQFERAQALSSGCANKMRVISSCVDHGPYWDSRADLSEAVWPEIDPDMPALLLYTSSKTEGVPNGALLTHRNVLAGATNIIKAHALSAEDRTLCILPLYYVNAVVVSVLAPLLSGGSVVMPARYSTSAFWGLLAQYQCTWFSLVPTIVDYLLTHHEKHPVEVLHNPSYKQVRFGRSASTALTATSQKAFEQTFGIPLIETMGSTKTAAQILSNPLPPFQGKSGSPGLAYANEVIVTRKNGQEAQRGEVGELRVRGDNVMLTFYKNPAATKKFLTDDGWLRTGDLGYQDEMGFFFLIGRD